MDQAASSVDKEAETCKFLIGDSQPGNVVIHKEWPSLVANEETLVKTLYLRPPPPL